MVNCLCNGSGLDSTLLYPCAFCRGRTILGDTMADYAEEKAKELKGSGGRDASSYKSDTGGMGGQKKMDKLAGSAPDSKKKDEGAYKSAALHD